MMLNVITNEYNTSASKTMHIKLKESPMVDPRKHMEPTNELTDGMDVVQSLCPSCVDSVHNGDRPTCIPSLMEGV